LTLDTLPVANAINVGKTRADGFPKERAIPRKDQKIISTKATTQRLKIGIYFVLWWSLNVVFNI
jgi:hypothetical protein